MHRPIFPPSCELYSAHVAHLGTIRRDDPESNHPEDDARHGIVHGHRYDPKHTLEYGRKVRILDENEKSDVPKEGEPTGIIC